MEDIQRNLQNTECGYKLEIQRDSKKWTQIHTSVFPELYVVCE